MSCHRDTRWKSLFRCSTSVLFCAVPNYSSGNGSPIIISVRSAMCIKRRCLRDWNSKVKRRSRWIRISRNRTIIVWKSANGCCWRHWVRSHAWPCRNSKRRVECAIFYLLCGCCSNERLFLSPNSWRRTTVRRRKLIFVWRSNKAMMQLCAMRLNAWSKPRSRRRCYCRFSIYLCLCKRENWERFLGRAYSIVRECLRRFWVLWSRTGCSNRIRKR